MPVNRLCAQLVSARSFVFMYCNGVYLQNDEPATAIAYRIASYDNRYWLANLFIRRPYHHLRQYKVCRPGGSDCVAWREVAWRPARGGKTVTAPEQQ